MTYPWNLNYDSDLQYYSAFNFHKEELQRGLTDALESEEKHPLVLVGPNGIGRKYLMEAAAFRFNQTANLVLRIAHLDIPEDEIDSVTYWCSQLRKFVNSIEKSKPTDMRLTTKLKLKLPTPIDIAELEIEASKAHSPQKDEIADKQATYSSLETFQMIVTEVCKHSCLLLHFSDVKRLSVLDVIYLRDLWSRVDNLYLAFSTVSGSEDDRLRELGDQAVTLEVTPHTALSLREALRVRGLIDVSDGLIDALLRHSGGASGFIASKLFQLYHEDALEFADEGWRIDQSEELFAGYFPSLREPLLNLLESTHKSQESTEGDFSISRADVQKFLELASLCGNYIPADLLLEFMGFSADEADSFLDFIDTNLVDRTEPWLIDRQYFIKGFGRDTSIYVFSSQLLRFLILEGLSEEYLTKLAEQLLRFLLEALPPNKRIRTTMLLEVARFLSDRDELDALDARLKFWVSKFRSQELTTYLITGINEKRYHPDFVWKLVRMTVDEWPAFRRLSLLSAYEQQPGGVPTEVYPVFNEAYGKCLFDICKFAEARQRFVYSYSFYCRKFGKRSDSALRLKYYLGLTAWRCGQMKKAYTIFESIVDAQREEVEQISELGLLIAQEFALINLDMGKFETAKEILEQVLRKGTMVFHPDHRSLILIKFDLAKTYIALSDLQKARELLEDVVSARSQLHGSDAPRIASVRGTLAEVLRRLGEPTTARDLHEKAVEQLIEGLGEDHLEVLIAKINFAKVLRDLDDHKTIRTLLKKPIADQTKRVGADHPYVLSAKRELALAEADMGNRTLALGMLEEVLTDSIKSLGDDHRSVQIIRCDFGKLLYKIEDFQGALTLIDQAVSNLRKHVGCGHYDLLGAKSDLSAVYWKLGEFGKAQRLLEEVIVQESQQFGVDSREVLESKHNLAMLFLDAGHASDARALHDLVIEGLLSQLGSDHPRLWSVREEFAAMLIRNGELTAARKSLTVVLEAQIRVLGPEHPETLRTKARLASME